MTKNKITNALIVILLLYSCKTIVVNNTISDEKKMISATKIAYNLYNYADSIGRSYNYFYAIDSVLQHKVEYINDSSSFQDKSYYYQVLMDLYCFIGEYETSIQYESLALNTKYKYIDTNEYINFKFIPAKEYVINNVKNVRAILFNEAHNRPDTRYFITSILKPLKEKGFTHLAIEGLSYSDTTLLKRKFPTVESGYYIYEPVFSNLIREALKLEFLVVPYDDTTSANNSSDFYEGLNKRDKFQAYNLKSILDENKNNKIIVLSGYDHIYRESDDKWKKMAEWLYSFYQDSIVSYDCVKMKRSITPEFELPEYRKIITKSTIKELPFVMIDTTTHKSYVPISLENKVDNIILFLKIDFKEIHNKSTLYLFPNDIIKEELSHIKIYLKDEYTKVQDKAIPIAQYRVNNYQYSIELFLKSNSYLIVFLGKNNLVLHKDSIEV